MTRKRHKSKKEKVRQPTPAQLVELRGIVEEASRLAVLCTCYMPETWYPCGMCDWKAFLGYHGMKGTLHDIAYTGVDGDATCFFITPTPNPTFGVASQVRFTSAGRGRTKPTVSCIVSAKMSNRKRIMRSGYKDTKARMVPMIAQLLAMLMEEGLKARRPLLDQVMANPVNVARIEALCGGYHALKASVRFSRR